MIINYDVFYRRFGLRLVSQMLSPRFGRLGNFQLPRGAVLHSAHGDTTKLGPVESELAFRGVLTELLTNGDVKARSVTRPIMVEHVMQMTDPIGRPIRANVIVNNLIRTYHQQHRRFRRITKIESALKDPNTMVVYNYDLLPHLYRYPRTFFNQYFEWNNIERKLWEEVAKCAVESDRPQFIIRNIPKILPARSSFQQAAMMNTAQPSRRVLKLFDTPEHLFLIELWKWLGKDRQSSMLAAIPRDKLRRVNIIFQESGSWIAVNLGVLDSWREPGEDERYENEPERTNLFNPDRFQIRALRFLMAIQQLRSESDPEITAIADQNLDSDDEEAVTQEYEMLVHKVEDRAAVKDALSGVIRVAETTQRATNIPQKIEEPDDTADTVKINEKTEQQIDADIAELEKMNAAHLEELQANDAADAAVTRDDPHSNSFAKIVKAPSEEPVVAPLPSLKSLALDEAVMAVCNQRADEGTMSAAQYRHYQTISKAYKTMISPDGKSTMEQYITIPPEKLKIAASKTIPDIATVSDKSMLKSSLLEFDERYIKEVLSRDVASMILSVQNAGIAVTSYNVETVDQVMGSFEMHSVRVVPVEGTASTLHFKLPVVEEDGSYTANGVKYRLRKQRGDLPIRKVKPDTVALTSYYGKVFVRRSEKKVNDWGNWLRNNIMAKWQEPTDHTVINAHPGDVSDNLFKAPRLYSALAKGFRTFMLQSSNLPDEFINTIFTMSFDHTKREKLYGADAIRQYEQNGAIIAGVGGINEDTYFLIGRHSTVAIAKDSRIVQVPSIEGVLGLDRYSAPVDFAVMKVSGESIPLGVILGYVMGLDNLIGLLNAKVRRVPAGKRLMLETHESAIVFNDESIVIDKNDQLSCMFLGGFKEYHRILKRFNSHLFNKRDVYLNLLEAAGMGVRYLREIDLFFQMFVDPITRDLLIEMKEPTDVRGLLLRAGSMLINDDHPDELDAAWMRIKGYERMAGAVYSELVRSIRSHNGAPGKARSGLDLNPYTIWTNIQTDPSKAMVMDINPIQNLREKEAVTYSGTGGRNSRTMTKHTREYHRNDMGTISGDTVDSSDVAINTYTSADPQFTSLRGISRRYDDGVTMGATTLLSSSALVSVGSDHDDPKRVNFIGIQHTHGMACNGYHQMAVRTGYEQVVAHRTSDLFAVSAPEDGKVVSVKPNGIVVQYSDGRTKGYETGLRYGNAAGLMLPHSVVPNVKVGQEFKKGSILSYNTGFFEKDLLNPTNVVWKAGVLARVALMEISATLEDSSAISEKLAAKLTTRITKIVPIVVSFDQNVRRLVKVGDKVNSEDILCIIEDAVTSNAGLFDEESLDTLRVLGNQVPQAKAKGTVERIEVFYHGDPEDMSDSLRAIALASDIELAARLKASGKKVLTGSVDEGFRIESDPLVLDSMAIRVYISGDVAAGEGDKGVFANQMKTVFGRKFSGDYKTESGETIDAIFGQKSIDDRIVLSPGLIGTTNVLLDLIGKKAFAAYNQ